ncbi:MAG: type II toxin-antitoxin system VapC family toxin [Methanobrevibacter sp.]|jgi:predicted nucleic acid-binding protein|nr:type II toxin-antitoxin system VapC family toxin [Methanobrevibacter sp.]
MIFLDANFLMAYFIETEDQHNIALDIWDKIKDEELIISNSIILEVMNVSNIKLKISKEKLKEIYISLNSGLFDIIDDTNLYDDTAERQMNYLPERLPFSDCLYLELMEQLEITKIATFDKHFNNKCVEVIAK